MSLQADISRNIPFQKLSSAGFTIGAIFTMIGMLWVASIDLSDPLQAQGRLRDQIVTLQAISLLMTFGWWAVMIGAAGVHHSITASGAEWARLGFYFLIIGTTLWTLGMSLDVTYSVLIANWMTAPREAIFTPFTVLAFLTIMWVLLCGLWITRKVIWHSGGPAC